MLYGFLGFKPWVDGFAVSPNLPADWPSITINRIYFHKFILTVKVSSDKKIMISGTGPSDDLLIIEVPNGYSVTAEAGISVQVIVSKLTR
jgi:cellobiose phosphorylase